MLVNSGVLLVLAIPQKWPLLVTAPVFWWPRAALLNLCLIDREARPALPLANIQLGINLAERKS